MSRTLAFVFALLATAPFLATANVENAEQWGKGMMTMAMPTHAGKGDVDVDVQCTDVCSDVCTPVPQKVCNEVPYQTQVCQKVPVQKTKQICNRICTKTTTMTETINTTPTVTSSGKGGEAVVTVSAGKGHRRLAGADAIDMLPLPLLVGKAMMAKAAGAVVGAKAVAGAAVISKGKGAEVVAAPQEDVQCNDVCNDVPITTYQTQCQMVTNTKTKCDIVFQQKCDKVCKPNCKKITTITTTSTTAVATGKGKGMPMQVSYGKGH